MKCANLNQRQKTERVGTSPNAQKYQENLQAGASRLSAASKPDAHINDYQAAYSNCPVPIGMGFPAKSHIAATRE